MSPIDESTLQRAGTLLRRVPGASAALDARLAWHARQARRQAARREAAFTERDRRWLASLDGRTDLRLNVGSSSEHVEGWINADLVRDPAGRCLRMDATEPWPFEEASAIAVNSEHVIEHIARDDAPRFFAEAFRALRPGGVIRTSTPDLEGMTNAYSAGDLAVLEAHRSQGYAARNHADLINNYTYLWGHRHIYDFATLELLLREAGFTEIERATFGQSRHADLRGVDTHDTSPLRDLVVIVDAVKPMEGRSISSPAT